MPMTKKEHEKELRCYPAALTVTEVAEILRVSTKTVYKLIKVCFLEKTPEKVWTCAVSCDIVRVGKNKKGVNANECHNNTCSQRTG